MKSFGKDSETRSIGASSQSPWPLEKTYLGYEAKSQAAAIRYDKTHPLYEAYLTSTHPLHVMAVREIQSLTEIYVSERGNPDMLVPFIKPVGALHSYEEWRGSGPN